MFSRGSCHVFTGVGVNGYVYRIQMSNFTIQEGGRYMERHCLEWCIMQLTKTEAIHVPERLTDFPR